MKRRLKQDIPAGAAIAVTALVLVASVVTGREDGRAPDRIVETAVEPAAAVTSEDLDLERLKRPKRDGGIQDLFTGPSWNSPPVRVATAPSVVAKPAPPAAPSAPPLPFKYLGRMIEGDKVVVFLERNQATLSAAAGDKLDPEYQVESIAESAVHFLYLPLGAKQILSIAAQY